MDAKESPMLESAIDRMDTADGPELVRAALAEVLGDDAATRAMPVVARLLREAWEFCPECDPGAKLFGADS